MKMYELELQIIDCFPAKNEKEAKEEMVKRIQYTLKKEGILWRIKTNIIYTV